MPNNVSWILQLSVKDGQLSAAKALMQEMVESTMQEPGAQSYEWYISPDGAVCHTHESFIDSAATMEHLGTFGEKFMARFMDCFQPTGFHVYGSPSDEVRAALDGFGVQYLGSFGGFTR